MQQADEILQSIPEVQNLTQPIKLKGRSRIRFKRLLSLGKSREEARLLAIKPSSPEPVSSQVTNQPLMPPRLREDFLPNIVLSNSEHDIYLEFVKKGVDRLKAQIFAKFGPPEHSDPTKRITKRYKRLLTLGIEDDVALVIASQSNRIQDTLFDAIQLLKKPHLRLYGEQRRKFQWLLQHNHAPEEARKLALNRVDEKRVSDKKKVEQSPPPPVVQPVTSMESAPIKVGILHPEYPDVKFTNDELKLIQEAILERVTKQRSDQLKPKFTASNVKSGWLEVECSNRDTSEWLKTIIPALTPWKKCKLQVIVKDEIFLISFTGVFRDSVNDSNEKVLSLIESQNESINTKLWHVLKREEKDGNVTLVISFPITCEEILKDLNYTLNYKFGHVNLTKSPLDLKEVEAKLSEKKKISNKGKVVSESRSNRHSPERRRRSRSRERRSRSHGRRSKSRGRRSKSHGRRSRSHGRRSRSHGRRSRSRGRRSRSHGRRSRSHGRRSRSHGRRSRSRGQSRSRYTSHNQKSDRDRSRSRDRGRNQDRGRRGSRDQSYDRGRMPSPDPSRSISPKSTTKVDRSKTRSKSRSRDSTHAISTTKQDESFVAETVTKTPKEDMNFEHVLDHMEVEEVKKIKTKFKEMEKKKFWEVTYGTNDSKPIFHHVDKQSRACSLEYDNLKFNLEIPDKKIEDKSKSYGREEVDPICRKNVNTLCEKQQISFSPKQCDFLYDQEDLKNIDFSTKYPNFSDSGHKNDFCTGLKIAPSVCKPSSVHRQNRGFETKHKSDRWLPGKGIVERDERKIHTSTANTFSSSVTWDIEGKETESISEGDDLIERSKKDKYSNASETSSESSGLSSMLERMSQSKKEETHESTKIELSAILEKLNEQKRRKDILEKSLPKTGLSSILEKIHEETKAKVTSTSKVIDHLPPPKKIRSSSTIRSPPKRSRSPDVKSMSTNRPNQSARNLNCDQYITPVEENYDRNSSIKKRLREMEELHSRSYDNTYQRKREVPMQDEFLVPSRTAEFQEYFRPDMIGVRTEERTPRLIDEFDKDYLLYGIRRNDRRIEEQHHERMSGNHLNSKDRMGFDATRNPQEQYRSRNPPSEEDGLPGIYSRSHTSFDGYP